MALRFSKMHGAGNDFVIIDARHGDPGLSATLIARIADRHRGVGFDQLIVIEPPTTAAAVAGYSIFNADGSRAAQCGNGARCVAAWLLREGAASTARFVLDSPAGPVLAQREGEGIGLDLGVPEFAPEAVGLDMPQADPYWVSLDGRRLEFGAVSMGNPHAVIEVEDVAHADVARIAPALQAHFAQGCNVGFAQVLGPDVLALRVYERGVGETLACGSGACAALAVLARRKRIGSQAEVRLPGGDLHLVWAGPGQPVHMSGPAQFVFEGEFLS